MIYPHIIEEIIEEALGAYNSQDLRLHTPVRNYTPSPSNHIRPSSVALCPLLAAYQKHRIPEDYPIDNQWIMSHGSYVEQMIQEPMMYAALRRDDLAYEPQVTYTHELSGVKYSGVADGVLRISWDGEPQKIVFEIKDTEGQRRRSVGEPKLRYIWQLLCGMIALGSSQGVLITCSKWTYNVYHLVEQDTGWVLRKDGEIYQTYGDIWNTSERINERELSLELGRYWRYNNAVGQGIIQQPPIEDPLNAPNGWLCVSEIKKATKTKPGLVAPNCSYCHRCHGLENKLYPTELVDGVTRYAERESGSPADETLGAFDGS